MDSLITSSLWLYYLWRNYHFLLDYKDTGIVGMLAGVVSARANGDEAAVSVSFDPIGAD
jgi:hypothetical protein